MFKQSRGGHMGRKGVWTGEASALRGVVSAVVHGAQNSGFEINLACDLKQMPPVV